MSVIYHLADRRIVIETTFLMNATQEIIPVLIAIGMVCPTNVNLIAIRMVCQISATSGIAHLLTVMVILILMSVI